MANDYISSVTLPNNSTYDFRDKNLKLYTGSCATAADTAIKDVTTDGTFTLEKGAVLFVNFTNTNSAAVEDLKLKLNGEADANAKPIKYLYNGNDPANIPGKGYLRANQTYMCHYDGTNWVVRLHYNTNSTYSYMRPYENTAKGGSANTQANNPAKTAAAGWKFQLSAGKYFMYTHYYDNTAQSAITLNIGDTGAKPIYINGVASSSTNYTLPGGQYLVYYDGTNYHFRTDNRIPGNISGDSITVDGRSITNTAPSASSTSATIPSSTAVWAAISGASGYGKTGTVTSVQIQANSPLTSSTSSAQTTNLSTTISFIPTTAHYVLAGPSSGSTTVLPNFRALVNDDLPSLGNISNVGAIAASTSSTIATNDALVISTTANSGKLTRSSIVFNTTNTTKVLSQAGTWIDMYTHPTGAGNKHIPSGGSDGQFLGYDSAGTAKWVNNPNTDEKVKQTSTTTAAAYKILLSTTSTPSSGTTYNAYYSTTFTYNPSTGALVVGGTITSGGYTVLTTNSSLAWSKLTDIPTASSSTAGIVKIGVDGGAATYEHTHSTTLTATGSASITLSANTVYTLTAGGNSVAFKMPADNDTHMNVSLAGAAITHNYILMTSTTPTGTAAQHTGLGATSLWVNSADKGKFELVLGNSTSTGSTGGQYGQLALYSESTAGTYLKAASGTAWKTATLPAATGMLAMIENSTAKGSDTKPIKIAATGLITECSTYAGGTKVTLNGTDKGSTTATIFAATTTGTAGQVLKSQGSGEPEWANEYSVEILQL